MNRWAMTAQAIVKPSQSAPKAAKPGTSSAMTPATSTAAVTARSKG